MKRISHPPMIIFLDVLFVFLFLLILNNNRVVDIVLPPGKLFDGAKIVYKKFDEYYTLDKKKYLKSRNFTYMGKCNSKIQDCRDAYMKYGEDVFIIYSVKLQEAISNLSLLALGNNTCKRIKFIVNKKGELEYKNMLDANNCLNKIKNYDDFFTNP